MKMEIQRGREEEGKIGRWRYREVEKERGKDRKMEIQRGREEEGKIGRWRYREVGKKRER